MGRHNKTLEVDGAEIDAALLSRPCTSLQLSYMIEPPERRYCPVEWATAVRSFLLNDYKKYWVDRAGFWHLRDRQPAGAKGL
jgi:hypothetical protein